MTEVQQTCIRTMIITCSTKAQKNYLVLSPENITNVQRIFSVGIILLGRVFCLIGGTDNQTEEIFITMVATFDAQYVSFWQNHEYQSCSHP
jgi:hypothetical protein